MDFEVITSICIYNGKNVPKITLAASFIPHLARYTVLMYTRLQQISA